MKFDSLKEFSKKAQEKNKAAPDVVLIRELLVQSFFEMNALATKIQNQLPSATYDIEDYKALLDIVIFLFKWFRPVLLTEYKDNEVIKIIEDYVQNPQPQKTVDVLVLLKFADLLTEFGYRKGIINIFQLNIPLTLEEVGE